MSRFTYDKISYALVVSIWQRVGGLDEVVEAVEAMA